MVRTRGRRHLTCIHEAGHALAHWYFGFNAERIDVLTVEQVLSGVTIEDRRGRRVRCEGLTSCYNIHLSPAGEMHIADDVFRAWYEKSGRVRAEISIVAAMAGLAAEVLYRKCSPLRALAGASDDREAAQQIVDEWLDDPNAVLGTGYSRARALVTSASGWTAVRMIADHLLLHGQMEYESIFAACQRAFSGCKPDHAAWDALWPPSLKQLRAGVVPPSRYEKAA